MFLYTLASDLHKSGLDIKQAQYILGHNDIKTILDTYTHFGYADVKVDKLESYYNAVNRKSDTPETRINTAFRKNKLNYYNLSYKLVRSPIFCYARYRNNYQEEFEFI